MINFSRKTFAAKLRNSSVIWCFESQARNESPHFDILLLRPGKKNDRKTHLIGNIYLSFFLLKFFIPAKKLETLHAVFSSNILGNERERASFIGLVLTNSYNNFTDPLENLHTQMLSSSRENVLYQMLRKSLKSVKIKGSFYSKGPLTFSDQKQTSPFNLWPRIGGTVWRNWQLVLFEKYQSSQHSSSSFFASTWEIGSWSFVWIKGKVLLSIYDEE